MLISVLFSMGNKTVKVGLDCLTHAYSYDDGIFVCSMQAHSFRLAFGSLTHKGV